MDDRLMYGLGGMIVGIVGTALYYQNASPKTSGSAASDSALISILKATKVRNWYANDSIAIEDPQGVPAFDWVLGAQRLGYQVGYKREDNKLELKRFSDAQKLKESGLLPVPSLLEGAKTAGLMTGVAI